jgi:Kef-type K+ transport system membrane component KefB/mannitol/fructose-specific phosphotransferase system IIA component (Ntr-type)
MTEHDTLLFLLTLAVLLGVARILGELARMVGLPLIVGEISTGIFLGPTLLGRVYPTGHGWLFGSPHAQTMLAGYTTVAAVLLLVVAGLEIDLSVVKRRGRSTALAAFLGVIMPMGGGVILGFMLPDGDLVHPEQRVLFSLFLGVALSISALPVIAKTLFDLGLFKTDLGLVVMSVATIVDVVGWLGFSVLLGPMRGDAVNLTRVSITVALTVAFVVVSFAVSKPLLNRVIGRIEDEGKAAPERVLSLVILVALLGAATTQALGVHAVFGAFIVGIVVGDSPRLKEHTRVVIHQFVTNIFAPVFFASLGLKVDFFRAFDLRLCVLVLSIATVAKVLGCSVGARLGGLKWRESAAVGFGLNARGAMEIILALIAHEAGLIREQILVALVVMALGTSLLSGPVMKRLLYRKEDEADVVVLLRRGAFLRTLRARTAAEAIDELADTLTSTLGPLAAAARAAVQERERMAPTGLGDEVAIPHAAVEGLRQPMLALGLAPHGLDFDAPDGRPARIVFLLVMPPKAYEQEVRVLASIARSVFDVQARVALFAAADKDAVLNVLGASGTRVAADSRGPRTRSLADI